jgi:hypothetical protein
LKIIVEARAVLKAVNSAALTKALAIPCLSRRVRVPLGDVVEGREPVVDTVPLVVGFVSVESKDWLSEDCVGYDGYSGISNELAGEVIDGGADIAGDEDLADPVVEGIEELSGESTRVTTLIPIPSMLLPGMKSVVDPSFRSI